MVDTASRLDNREVILTVRCSERNGEIDRTIKLGELSFAKLKFLYEKTSQFDTLFNDFTGGGFRGFVNALIHQGPDGPRPTGLLWEVDDVGLIMVEDIAPGRSALVHVTFWDRIFRGREDLMRAMAKHVFTTFGIHRLRLEIPKYAGPARGFAKRCGFKQEGIARESVLYKGDWFDVYLFSLLEHEV